MAENGDRLRQLAVMSVTVEQVDAVVRAWQSTSQVSVWFNDIELAGALADLAQAWPEGTA